MFRYYSPVDVRFGFGVRGQVLDAVAALGGRAFVVVDPMVATSELFLKFAEGLKLASECIWASVEPNPSVRTAQLIADFIKNTNASCVIAVGGGSVLDAAKAAALSAGTGILVEQFHQGIEPVKGNSIPLIAIPTTAGTGSEVTMVSVLTDVERGIKAPIGGPALFPRIALVDPEWTLSVPPSVTAATGMDALSHALEGYWSVHHQPFCDLFAQKSAELVFRNLENAFSDPNDREAREALSLASLLGGLAFAQPKTAAVHACSFVLTQRYGLSHGVACALTLDAFLVFNAEHDPMRLDAFARAIGLGCSRALATKIRELKSAVGLPCSLKEANIPESEIDLLVRESFHPNMLNNPREVKPELLRSLYLNLS
jgi:alcohol dehydrogenase